MIEVQGLTKYFGARPAIIDLTFSVPRGQVLGFLGPHGAGKSTTMRVLAGYLGATSGTASLSEVAVTSSAGDERHLSVIGEGDDLREAVARLIVGEGLSLRSQNSHSLSLGDEYLELCSEEAS